MTLSIRQHSAFRRLASCTVPGNCPGFPRSIQPTLTPQGALQLIPKESEQVQFVITTSLRPIPRLACCGQGGWGRGGGKKLGLPPQRPIKGSHVRAGEAGCALVQTLLHGAQCHHGETFRRNQPRGTQRSPRGTLGSALGSKTCWW